MSRKYPRWFFAAGLILLLAAGIASAAIVPQNISFSGNLTNAAGTPLTGKYTVTFRLYNVATGGTVLGTDTHAVTASKGLYTTWLSFPAMRYNGQALWVGVQRAPDIELRQRTILYPAPYALGLRPGAVIAGSGTAPVINVSNSAGVAVFASGKEGGYFTTTQAGTPEKKLAAVDAVTSKNYNPGLDVLTTGYNSFGVNISTSGAYSNGVESQTRGPYSNGIYARTGGMTAYGVNALTTGPDSIAVSGTSLQDIGVYGEGRTGAFFTTNQGGTLTIDQPAVNVTTAYDNNPGMEISTKGDYSNGMSISTSGPYSYAVYIQSESPYGAGVNAHMRKENSVGIHSVTYLDDSTGVFGMSEGADCTGVEAYSVGPRSNGVSAYARGTGGRGVYGESKDSEGVAGEADGAAGVKGHSQTKAGVWGISETDVGLYAVTNRTDHMYGVYTPDYIYARGSQFPSVDVAEYFPISGSAEPGTVMIIVENGRLTPSSASYDTRVAGIVSTDPAVSLGARDTGNPGEAVIAIAGRVPCSVDATNAPIHAGDLLTTSERPGYAMKAVPTMIAGRGFYPDGTILGKALGSLESGTGTIDVLVTLQ